MKPPFPTTLFMIVVVVSGCAGDSAADPPPSEPQNAAVEQTTLDTTTSTAATEPADVTTSTAAAEPAYVTRAMAERDGLHMCESPGKDISERSYTYEYARNVIRNLDVLPLVVPDAEITIGYTGFVDGYVQIGDVGDPERVLEVFDNYQLEPPLEMYCFLPGEAGVIDPAADPANTVGPSD